MSMLRLHILKIDTNDEMHRKIKINNLKMMTIFHLIFWLLFLLLKIYTNNEILVCE